MASVTQQIPNYIFGISEQPDELKIPGQVRDCLNALPDVTRGLVKRPGTETVADISGFGSTDSLTHWFHIYRDENEQYIGKITKEGKVYVWDNKGNIKANGLYNSYLEHTGSSEDVQVLSVNDFTFINNRTKKVTMNNDKVSPIEKNCAFISLKQIKPGTQYALDVAYPDSGVSHKTNRATNIAIKNGAAKDGGGHAWNTDEDFPGDGSCQYAARQLFQTTNSYTENNGTERNENLWFELESRCVPGSKPYDLPGVPIPPQPEDFLEDAPTDGKQYVRQDGEWTTIDFPDPPDPEPEPDPDEDDAFSIQPRDDDDVKLTDPTPIEFFDVYTDTALLKFGGENQSVGKEHKVGMTNSKVQGNWTIVVTGVEPVESIADICWVRPNPTPFEGLSASADSVIGGIIEQLKQAVDSRPGFEGNTFFSSVEQIGNGIYLEGETPFKVTAPDESLFDIIQNSAEDISKLPSSCKNGYVVKVANSGEQEDDYYLKFVGDKGSDGVGTWEETLKPAIAYEFDASTMPLQLVRQKDMTFKLEQPDWEDRLVGDGKSNPIPSFCLSNNEEEENPQAVKTINKVIFFRNRLGFLSDENVILSRAGDFFNFWSKTATTVVPIDPIDISCSSQTPAILYEAVEMNAGLVMFAENQQFILTTDNDSFTATTAKINAMSTYRYNKETHPVSLGTSLVFLNNGGTFTRVFEMQNITRDQEPTVIEQSKLVSKLIEEDYNLIAESKENSFMAIGKRGSDQLWIYRYFNSGDNRIQSAWVRWTLPSTIEYHCIMGDKYYAVGTDGKLYSIGVKPNDDLYGSKSVYLDSQMTIPVEAMTYSKGRTTFKRPRLFDGTKDVKAFRFEGYQRRYAPAVVEGDTVTVPGDWTAEPLTLGAGYKMSVEFPTVFPQRKQGDAVRSDVRSSVVVHRIKLNLEDTNIYNTILKRKGKPDYNYLHESTPSDEYNADATPYLKNVDQTIPVYERNTNFNLTLESEYPCACTLLSMNWEGDYNPKYYKSV